MSLELGLYVNNSKTAVEAYIKAFGLELGYHVLNDDGTYFHSELFKKDTGTGFAVVQSNKSTAENNPVQLCYTFESREELTEAFGILRDGGEVLMDICELPWSPCAAEVIDRFGIRWYLTIPQHRPPDSFTPDNCK